MCRSIPTVKSPWRVGPQACLLMGPPWLLSLRTKVTHTCPPCPARPHPSWRAWWAASGKEQGHSFHDDAPSQDSHTQWDGDVSG